MADDTKNLKITEEVNRQFEEYNPGSKEREVLSAVLIKFRSSSDERNRSFAHFDGDDLIHFIEDSVKRFTTNIDIREGTEDWQSIMHDPFTRNKVLATLGKVVQVLPIAEARGRGDEDVRRGQIASNLYEYSEDVDDYDKFLIKVLLEAIIKGTAVAYEGHEKKEQAIRNIVGNGEKVRIKKDTKKTNRLYGELVRLEDFYPSSVGIDDIDNMPYCFWRIVLPYQQFLQDFASFSKSADVSPFQTFSETSDDRPEYLDYIGRPIIDGQVEIIRYYNRDTDEYIVLANGVWLNPLTIGDGMEISPLPFNHKELPFWSIKFEMFEGSFFYGKSLPDKLKSMQDVLNVLNNMLLDQSFLTVFKPVLTTGFDSIEDDYLRPGRRIPVDTQGLPLKDAYQVLDVGTPSGWHQYIMEHQRKIMEEASLDQVSQGVAGVGDRTTAREIGVAAEGVSSMIGLFGRQIKSGIKRKASLRIKNILQFWTDEDSPMVEKILGQGGIQKTKKAFNVFKFDNAVMTDGKRGVKVIEMFSKSSDMPTKMEQKVRAEIFKLETGKEVEIIAVPAEYIREIDFDIKLIANPKSEMTKDSEKAMQLEKVRVYLSFFPELVDKPELAAQTAEKMGDDPTKIFKESMFPGLVDEGAAKSQFDNGMSTQPEGNMSNNAVRGLRGGEQGSNELQNLQNQLTG